MKLIAGLVHVPEVGRQRVPEPVQGVRQARLPAHGWQERELAVERGDSTRHRGDHGHAVADPDVPASGPGRPDAARQGP